MIDVKAKLKEVQGRRESLLRQMNEMQARIDNLSSAKSRLMTEYVKLDGGINILTEMVQSETAGTDKPKEDVKAN